MINTAQACKDIAVVIYTCHGRSMTTRDGWQLHPSQAALASDDEEAEQLRDRIAVLTAAVEARDTFIAIAAHELRNPMTPIIGQIDLLRSAVRANRSTPEEID